MLRNLRIGSPPIKSRYRERRTRRKLNAEVAKQLPNDLSKNAIEKRVERFMILSVILGLIKYNE